MFVKARYFTNYTRQRKTDARLFFRRVDIKGATFFRSPLLPTNLTLFLGKKNRSPLLPTKMSLFLEIIFGQKNLAHPYCRPNRHFFRYTFLALLTNCSDNLHVLSDNYIYKTEEIIYMLHTPCNRFLSCPLHREILKLSQDVL